MTNATPAPNSKGDLIARMISLGLGTPTFDTEVTGPPHERTFQVQVSVGRQVMGRGEGRTKKEAERLAAEAALQALETPATHQSTPGESWPIYAAVLAQAVEAALEFAPDDAALEDVQEEAAHFYRGLLVRLGHGPIIQDAEQ